MIRKELRRGVAKGRNSRDTAGMSAIITLLSDFGGCDAYAGIMKGVILGICPDARIVDLTHDIPPQDVLAGAFQLSTALAYFPPGSIHVAVVDPGVGTDRRAIAVKTADHILIAPDNGILTLALRRTPALACYCLDRSRFKLPELSRTFHGRDVFAPIAAHLAAGRSLRQVGAPVSHIETMTLATTRDREDGGLEGQVLHIDHFGNAITNIEASQVNGLTVEVEVHARDLKLSTVSSTYGDVERNAPLALIGSHGFLELAVREGSVALAHGVSRGTVVSLLPRA